MCVNPKPTASQKTVGTLVSLLFLLSIPTVFFLVGLLVFWLDTIGDIPNDPPKFSAGDVVKIKGTDIRGCIESVHEFRRKYGGVQYKVSHQVKSEFWGDYVTTHYYQAHLVEADNETL